MAGISDDGGFCQEEAAGDAGEAGQVSGSSTVRYASPPLLIFPGSEFSEW